MKTAVVCIGAGQGINEEDIGKIAAVYDGAPNQSSFGGYMGDAQVTKHVDFPSGHDQRWTSAQIDSETGDITFVDDDTAKTNFQAQDASAAAGRAIANAAALCQRVKSDFMTGNALLGMAADGVATKQAVLAKLAGVLEAVNAGDPDLVIAAIQAIDPGDYDVKYITAVRLLAAGNTIRVAMGKSAVGSIAALDD